MQSAREKLAPVLDSISFRAPKIPVLSNITGKPHSSDGSEIRALMLEQITGTTNWAADVETAKALGATRFIEFGPGKVLSGLVKKIDPSLEAFSVPDVASLEAVAAL
jgi:[acyl-carrier-protein] S-malonyltransferase